MIEKKVAKSHRQKIEEFNTYLSKMPEHHDIPRVRLQLHGIPLKLALVLNRNFVTSLLVPTPAGRPWLNCATRFAAIKPTCVRHFVGSLGCYPAVSASTVTHSHMHTHSTGNNHSSP